MAEKARYPQIPSTVWWGVHAILNKTPNATLDERFLTVHLKVQPAAAKQYVTELKSVGILDEECKATPLARKWRLDTSYSEAVEELISTVYPQGLRDVAPPGEGDRQKVISWFLQEGLGQGSAGNKASTYLMLSSQTPNEAPPRGDNGRNSAGEAKSLPRDAKTTKTTVVTRDRIKSKSESHKHDATGTRSDSLPLNVNVQIHISADAGSEQIESIFSAMRRYLYDQQNS